MSYVSSIGVLEAQPSLSLLVSHTPPTQKSKHPKHVKGIADLKES